MPDLPRALLVDLDDTILAYTAAGGATWRAVCEAFAGELDGVGADALVSAVEAVAHWYWSDAERHRRGRLDMFASRRTIVRGAFDRLGVAAYDVADRLADAFTVQREEALEPFPGAIDALAVMRERGVRLALITNGSAKFQRRKVERFALDPLFDAVCIEGELGFGKPDRRVFETALARLRVPPTAAWVVGDNLDWDIAPALELGMTAVWVDHASRGLPARSDVRPSRTVAAFAELIE